MHQPQKDNLPKAKDETEDATLHGMVARAFASTARALRQLNIERIRVIGLSKGCEGTSNFIKTGSNDKNNLKDDGSATKASSPCGMEGPYDERYNVNTEAGDKGDAGSGVRVVSEKEFMQEFVFQSRPCVILDAIEDWPALELWKQDRYLFDLDHRLPLEPEMKDDDNDSGYGNSGHNSDDNDSDHSDRAKKQEKKRGKFPMQNSGRQSQDCPTSAEPFKQKDSSNVEEPNQKKVLKSDVHVPKKVTVALTPNGRADAVTYVLYDKRDVPVELRKAVLDEPAKKSIIPLSDHPLYKKTDPDGEIIAEKLFMQAVEVKVTLPELYELFSQSAAITLPPAPMFIDMQAYKSPSTTPVIAYAQLQNDCLNSEYAHLRGDIQENVVEFGKRVFGGSLEATNVWFGTPASVSSMHQDWVENLYTVVRGVKEFILVPPWEGLLIPRPDLPSASFALDENLSDRANLLFAFTPFPSKDGTRVPWFDYDISSEALEVEGEAAATAALRESIRANKPLKSFVEPLLGSESLNEKREKEEKAENKEVAVHPFFVHVHEGETLYLPALWLHRVSQHAGVEDISARARHRARSQIAEKGEEDSPDTTPPPLPLIAAVNYWFDICHTNPAIVMLREFGLLL